ncbi:T9SS type A sorting domain-containing protein [Tamlana sp. 2201CG12-4]|uniref:T9SS type A sorting domain-containing protein n=1 Tax=Tamlana sp. 2201CG12-4 TaxID=3112582 RepID=UPI002DBBB614|nr:T9SS type A sorting domain-containing protein [Tamlana sp. 2201CG12-4]MEC3907115.1 T9SS type A sorting domain-containing protein [Tamlana sp. 2201CG12-4]
MHLLLISAFSNQAQTTLVDGDIAFTRYNAGDDSFSFVFLTDVTASTEFFITDEGWDGSAFYGNESTIKFVVNTNIVAGEECHVTTNTLGYTMTSGNSPMSISSVGIFDPSLGNMLGTFGDNLFGYQSSSNIIAGINGDNGISGSPGNAWFASASASTNGSILPSGKTNGSNGFLGLFPNGVNSEVDNARYKASANHNDSKADLLASLMNINNWDFDNSTAYPASSTVFNVSPVLSIEKKGMIKNFELFPNPASDFIEISGLELAENQFEIYNTLGVKVKEGRLLKNKKLSVEGLKAGIYIIRLNNNQNLKFVKK